MKKLLIILLCFLFVTPVMPALAAPGDAVIVGGGNSEGYRDTSLYAMAVIGNDVYLSSYDSKMYTYKNETLTEYAFSLEALADEDVKNASSELRALLADGETLYALIVLSQYDMAASRSTIDGASLYKLTFNDDLTVTFSDPLELDWDDMIEASDDYEYSREVMDPFILNGKLIFFTYGYSGGYEIMVYDLENGEAEIYENENLRSIANYKDGLALIATVDYNTDNPPMAFATFDPDTGDTAPLFEYPAEEYRFPESITYDAKNDYLYYLLSGEIYRIEHMDVKTAQSVASIPLDAWAGGKMQILENGYIAARDYNKALIRNPDPSQRSSVRLTVLNNSGINSITTAYNQFQDAHKDVEVILSDRYVGDTLIQDMMSRSTDIDIYSLSCASAVYQALYERGYLAELTGSEKLSALVDSMYPALQDAVKKDGELVALPIDIYTNCPAINLTALEKIGVSKEELPQTWLAFAEFLKKLEGKLDDAGITVFEPYMTAQDAKMNLIYSFFSDYMNYLASADSDKLTFDTPLFKDTLAAIESVDFTELGMPEERNDDYTYNDEAILMESYYDVSAYSYRRGSQYEVLPLAIDDGANRRANTDMTLMFVNPYSQNRELAIEFLSVLADNLNDTFLVHACPDRNEPIPNTYYEQSLESYTTTIEALKQSLEEAPDDEKELLKLNLEEYEGYMKDFMENGMWSISAEGIAQYRENAKYIGLTKSIGLDGENSQEIYTQLSQYMDGAIDLETMAKNIDKKLKMMLMEGM